MKQLLRFSYYRRLQVSFLLLILFPTLLVSYYNYSFTSENVRDKVSSSSEYVLSMMSKDVSQLVDDLTYASTFFILEPNALKQIREFRRLYSISSSAEAAQYYRLKESLSSVATKSMNADIYMFLANEHDFLVISSDRITEEAEKHFKQLEALVDKGQRNVIQWLGPIHNSDKGTNVYYMSRVFSDATDYAVNATLYIGIESKYFDKLFGQIPSGSYALFDREKRLIAGNHAISYEEDPERNKNVRKESIISTAGWKLVYETEKMEITGEISQSFYWSMLTVLPFFLLFLLVSLLIAKRLHLPIRHLQLGVKLFGQGKRDIRFHVKGHDEISELGRTLNVMLDQINDLITEIEQETEQKRIYELQALFAQIRPHFLLNTLNSIKCNLAFHDDEIHSRQIEALMNLLRGYMKINEAATLEGECTLIANYIKIMQMRSDIEVTFDVELDPSLSEIEFPRLLLQPIVENIFIHGFHSDLPHPTIRLQARKLPNRVQIMITNNGEGIPAARCRTINQYLEALSDKPEPGFDRIGLINTLQRLRLTYGQDAKVRLHPLAPGGTTVELNFNFKNKESSK